jgi:GTPase SAR1 family protein
MKANGVELFF